MPTKGMLLYRKGRGIAQDKSLIKKGERIRLQVYKFEK